MRRLVSSESRGAYRPVKRLERNTGVTEEPRTETGRNTHAEEAMRSVWERWCTRLCQCFPGMPAGVGRPTPFFFEFLIHLRGLHHVISSP